MPSTSLSTRVQFWGPALFVTPMSWLGGLVVLMDNKGETFPRAAALASFGTVGGLLLWLAYRTASKRRDGLASFILGMLMVLTPPTHGSLWWELGRCAYQLAFTVPFFYVVGLVARWWGKPLPNTGPSRP